MPKIAELRGLSPLDTHQSVTPGPRLDVCCGFHFDRFLPITSLTLIVTISHIFVNFMSLRFPKSRTLHYSFDLRPQCGSTWCAFAGSIQINLYILLLWHFCYRYSLYFDDFVPLKCPKSRNFRVPPRYLPFQKNVLKWPLPIYPDCQSFRGLRLLGPYQGFCLFNRISKSDLLIPTKMPRLAKLSGREAPTKGFACLIEY